MELTPNEEKLANEIAEILNDMESLQFHRGLVKQYSESYLREKLAVVLKTPKEKIRSSRAAYFNYLVNSHAKPKKNYSRNQSGSAYNGDSNN